MSTTPSSSTFMLLLRGGVSSKDLTPQHFQEQIESYMNWIESLKKNGHFLAGEPLKEEGKILSGRSGQTITDGPFVESKEAVGGYFLISARDCDAAVKLAQGCPIFGNGGTIEVRPIQVIPAA